MLRKGELSPLWKWYWCSILYAINDVPETIGSSADVWRVLLKEAGWYNWGTIDHVILEVDADVIVFKLLCQAS